MEPTSPSIAHTLASRTTLHEGYDPARSVSPTDQRLLLEAAFSAPTGGGQRALEFFSVSDRAALDALSHAHRNFTAPASAPFAIVIAGNRQKARYPELLDFDAGAAAMAICVEAAELGLTTCCMSIAPQYDRMYHVARALGIAMDGNDPALDPLMMVAVGYPAPDTVSGASVVAPTESRPRA